MTGTLISSPIAVDFGLANGFETSREGTAKCMYYGDQVENAISSTFISSISSINIPPVSFANLLPRIHDYSLASIFVQR